MEALYALPLAAGRDGAAALIHLGACAALVAGVFALARREGGEAAGWSAALLLAGQPNLLACAGQAHADGALALAALAGAHALARWDEDRCDGRLAAAGLLAGLAGAVKLTGGVFAAAWLVWLALRVRRAREPLLFAACALVFPGPWLVRTWLSTGDPFWPLFAGPLHAGPDAARLAARLVQSNVWTGRPPLWLLSHGGPGFLLLPAAALAALAGRARPRLPAAARLLLWPGLVLAAAFLRNHDLWRALLPAYAGLAVWGGRCAAAAFPAGGARRAAAAALIAAGAAPLAFQSPNNALFAVLAPRSAAAPGADRRELFEDLSLDTAAFLRAARAALPPGARVLFFREIRGYGAGFDYQWGDPMNQALIDYRALRGPEELAARLKELGIAYVLDHPASGLYREDPGYYDRRTLALMAETLRRHGRVALERDGLVLYQLL
jgi:4-amino-4-deoxy-L-arabinose transferase-like glycosyltransferase